MEERTCPETTIHDLPEQILTEILSRVDESDLKRTTFFVNKEFCTISSSLVRKLTLKEASLTCEELQRLFRRFPCTKKIHIIFQKADKALSAISNSALNLERLKLESPRYPAQQIIVNMSESRVFGNIKSLKMMWFGGRVGSSYKVVAFMSLFPSLTALQLDFRFRPYNGSWKDEEGICKFTSKLPNLRKIVIHYNSRFTVKILDALTANCSRLESVDFRGCRFNLDEQYKILCNNLQLKSVKMTCDMMSPLLHVTNWVQIFRRLKHLYLDRYFLRDGFLIALAESKPLLKSLQLSCSSRDEKCTMSGLSQLLSACPGLERLRAILPCDGDSKNHDVEISMIVKKLEHLKYVNLSSSFISQATLFSLVQNCPLLETIRIWTGGDIEKRQICNPPTKKNYSIRSIDISPQESEFWLRSSVEPYCPNLRKKDIMKL